MSTAPAIQQPALGGDYWTPDAGRGARLFGIADVHAHLMTHLAFGHQGPWGLPDGPIATALCARPPSHRRWGWELSLRDRGWKRVRRGYPSFADWPTCDGISHQQMYVEWIRRAWQGGLRLMVSFAVNNELLAWVLRGTRPYDDATAIVEQVEATRQFASRHSDFLQIAYSPADARRVISSGRLAIVLGVEVDSVVECGVREQTPADVARWLSQLHDLGVRHVFPMHLADNVVGGAAAYHPLFDLVNRWLRGRPFELRRDPDVEFRIGDSLLLRVLAQRWVARHTPPTGGHVNVHGLSAFGRDVVLPNLMRLGMVIDIDHMSAASVQDVLALAERRGYPLVAGHTAFRALAFTRAETANPLRLTNEYQRTASDVDRLAGLGGLIGIGLTQGDLREYTRGRIRVPNDLAGSSKTWAQAYLYTVDALGGAPIAIGSDANGLVGGPGPRFGPRAAAILEADAKRRALRRGQVETQGDAVAYELTPTPGLPCRQHPPLTGCVTGDRRFDVNVDGMAHYGMLPDFLQDLRNVGIPATSMAPLFASADAYVDLWERCRALGTR